MPRMMATMSDGWSTRPCVAPSAAASALQDRQRFVDEIAVVFRRLSGGCHLIDDLREHLCNAIRCLLGRNSELLRDLSELTLTENLLQNTRIDRQVRAGADPRLRLLAVTGLLKLGENALKTAVLLQQLQRHQQQRILCLRARAAQRAARRVAELAAHGTARAAAQYAAEDCVENSHDPSCMCEGRSLRRGGGNARRKF